MSGSARDASPSSAVASGAHEHPAHDWSSPAFVASWAAQQEAGEADRRLAFEALAGAIPYGPDAEIRILDIGAGHGALAQVLLERFPRATAVCQDGSVAMAALGTRRMAAVADRVDYRISDLREPGWSAALGGPYHAVVSSLAIHHVGDPAIIRRVFREIHGLVRAGGVFLDYDLHDQPVARQKRWLRAAGFVRVHSYHTEATRSVFGGTRIRR